MKRAEIVAEARKHIGKAKWQRMGRSPQSMDCYGLVMLVRKAFGLKSEDWQRYETYPSAVDVIGPASRMFTQVHPPFKDGQFIVFQHSGRPVHVGITGTDKYGRPTVIHCAANRKVCCEEALESALMPHFRALFDFPGIED